MIAVLAQVVGAVLLVAGVALFSVPVALIVAGLLLLGGGTLAERAAGAAG